MPKTIKLDAEIDATDQLELATKSQANQIVVHHGARPTGSWCSMAWGPS